RVTDCGGNAARLTHFEGTAHRRAHLPSIYLGYARPLRTRRLPPWAGTAPVLKQAERKWPDQSGRNGARTIPAASIGDRAPIGGKRQWQRSSPGGCATKVGQDQAF